MEGKRESGARGLREESDHGDLDLQKWHSMYHLLLTIGLFGARKVIADVTKEAVQWVIWVCD